MNVSAAAIITAHHLVFGAAMPSDKPFAQAANEIKEACAQWPTLMKHCDAVKNATDDAGKYLPYDRLAVLAGERMQAATLLECAMDAYKVNMTMAVTRQGLLQKMAATFDRLGPYAFAKKYGVLLNNSAEEFAVQFMGAYNAEVGRRY